MEKIHEHGGKSSESLLDKGVILGALDVQAGQIVFDAGCGNGYMSREFAKLVGEAGEVYSMDMHEESISKLKANGTADNMVVLLGDITEKSIIEDCSIDLVYLSTVFHGFTESQEQNFIQEVKRVLKPSGVLAIIEIKKEAPFGPSVDIRVGSDELVERIGLTKGVLTEIGDYFYMQTFVYEG